MKKTIKELADELGVSKQAIRKHLDKLPDTLSVTKEKGIVYLNTDVETFVKSRITKVTSKVTDNVSGNLTDDFMSRILFLEKQMEIKDKQLETKDNQLEIVYRLLDQQQQLTLQANKKIEQLELSLTEEVEEEEIVPTKKEVSDISSDKVDVREETPLTFFQRLFGKRK